MVIVLCCVIIVWCKMYSVIQFTCNDGGTISVVNSQWLTPRKCEVYWPPVKSSKSFERLLPSASDKNWQLYGVQRVFYETDSLEKAKQKLKLAEVNSDLQTEEETEVHRPTKRRAIRTRRYISSDEENDNDNHVRPPPLKKQFFNSQTEEIGPSTSTPKYITTARENNSDFSQDISLPTLPTSFLQNIEPVYLTSAGNQRTEKDNLKLTDYQDKVLSLLTLIKTQNDQILSTLKQKRKGVILKPDYKFPLKTSEELQATEVLLKNQENHENLVSYLETLGGRDTSNKVSRIMNTLLADCLAKEFNFYGKRSQKMPFCQLLLRNCVVESVKNLTGATEKEIEDHIKVWLKHAPERLRIKEKKNNNYLYSQNEVLRETC